MKANTGCLSGVLENAAVSQLHKENPPKPLGIQRHGLSVSLGKIGRRMSSLVSFRYSLRRKGYFAISLTFCCGEAFSHAVAERLCARDGSRALSCECSDCDDDTGEKERQNGKRVHASPPTASRLLLPLNCLKLGVVASGW